MCFILHMASTAKVPRQAWDEHNRHLCIEDIHGVEENVRAHFSLPEIAYVGSSLGCGCGFRSVSFQNGGWPEEWMIEQGECAPPDDHIQDHQELYDLVSSLLADGHPVEFYGCWDGDERDETVHRQSITADRLLDPGFWFRERGFYGITQSEQAGSSNGG
jgi:hypothetical protein